MKIVRGYRNVDGGITPPIEGYGATRRQFLRGAAAAGAAAAFGCASDPLDFGDDSPHAAPDSGVPPEYDGNTVFLTGSATLAPKAQQDINNEALRNPFDYPIEIHELRFSVIGAPSSVGLGQTVSAPYASPAASILVGFAFEDDSAMITKNLVPLYSICEGQKLGAESVQFTGVLNSGAIFFAGTYTLRLKTPLVLKPRELLKVTVANNALVASGLQIGTSGIQPGTATVYVSYACRTRENLTLGRTRTVPYFAAWSPQGLIQPATGAPSAIASAETDLINQCGKPVQVERFVGRVAQIYAPVVNGVATSALTEFTDSMVAGDGGARPGLDVLQCQMTRSNGLPIIPPNTPFRLAFDSFTRSWEVGNADLTVEQDDYFVAKFQIAPPDATQNIVQQTAQMFASIGMIAYREESF
jgi:hypothetical protein